MSKGFIHELTYNESKEWYTPRFIFEKLNIQFDLDPCSPGKDVVPWIPAHTHYTIKDNGFAREWFGNVFMNPPYGMDTPKWMAMLAKHGKGIALVFSRTDVKWFHNYIPKADTICFIKSRVNFVRADEAVKYGKGLITPKGGCGAGSMLVAYGKENAQALFNSNLGLALPVSKPHSIDVQNGGQFMGATDHSNESPSPNTEPGRAIDYYIKKYKGAKR